MTIDEQDTLRRFHRALVREIQGSNPDHLTSPFTVAEIYQNLVPYRTHRDELGLEMNADYEHALLRLLAGEGEFLTIESRTARQEIKEELESPNPNTGLFRDFAAADVRLNPERLEEALSHPEFREADGDDGVPEDDDDSVAFLLGEDSDALVDGTEEFAQEGVESDGDDVQDSREEVPEEVEGAQVQESDPSEDEEDEVEEVGQEETEAVGLDAPPFENCPWCRENLPQRPGVRFCPFCGSNVQLVPCPECGQELELNWRFCVACGTEVAS